MIEIKAARWEDCGQVAALIEQLEEMPIDKARFEAVYRANLSNPQIDYQTAWINGVLAGFLSVHIQNLLHHTSAIAEIEELVVDVRYRGQGVGKCLFDQAKKIAAQAGCPQLECACNQHRTASHEFYKRQGMACRHYKFTLPLK
ncbi:GNAT family N-acetyltransferase [Holdemania massiliensis]|uniref:GNAT family N-acetyltransferase n=1 Tax=Holdemania massiliensis TaxID=1468449 RepID=UPI003521456E